MREIKLVKLLTNDEEDKIDNPEWHLSIMRAGGEMLFCSGEFYGAGDSGATYITKIVKSGKEITCSVCIKELKEFTDVLQG